MRLSSPIVWIVCVVIGGLFFVVLGVARVVDAMLKAIRARGWETERRARATWQALDARVVSARRITDDGLFILVIELPEGKRSTNPYATPSPRSWKRVGHVGEKLADLVEHTETLPVVVGPSGAVVVIDIPTLVARSGVASLNAEALAAEDFTQRGRWKWRPAETTA